ncbi:MAG: chondroitinase-B domain-containing protein [Pseudomonadota bacterium]
MKAIGMAMLIVALGATTGCAALPETSNAPETALRADAEQRLLVTTQTEYAAAMQSAQPGDTITLANGVWQDFDLVLDAEGTADAPIKLVAETPGEVILSGQSSLRLGGQHLIVSGLVFKDGFTPLNEVISFRVNSERLAFNSRVTNTVVEAYNNPDRVQRDTWVVMYGQNNEFDHNHLSGKLNSGPTMTVRLNSQDSQNNNHHIHHNYFGPRPVFGSNGGETLRIGTSHYSLTTSGTRVENNFFDRCSGEVEIVSNKSGGNTYRGNTFFESRGTLTLRHGNGTVVEDNLFEGNRAPYTGGVRVINAQQTIRNNMFRHLTGTRFSGALVVMNGVPNSPINRYHQVDGAEIVGNSFDHVSTIELGEGSDRERSAVPINSRFQNNLVIGSRAQTPFNLYDDMSGIAFADNLTNLEPPAEISNGFVIYADGATLPESIGAQGAFGVAKVDTGVDWYPKAGEGSRFEGGEVIQIEPGENKLFEAVSSAAPGDEIILAPGRYNEAKSIDLKIPVTVRATEPGTVMLSFERRNLFQLSSDGALRLSGLTVTGASAPDNVGNSFITSTTRGGPGNHVVELTDMTFEDFVINRAFSIVTAAKGTFYDRVEVRSSRFENVSGVPFKFDAETDDFGIYNVEYLIIEDSAFSNVRSSVASIYRGGRDESTFGPHAFISRSTFSDVGAGSAPLAVLHGAQNIRIEANEIDQSEPVRFVITTGIPKVVHTGNIAAGGTEITALVTEDLRK